MNKPIHGSVEATAATAKAAMRITGLVPSPLAAAGVRSCYNCIHRKKHIRQQPCDECLRSPCNKRSHFEASKPEGNN